MSYQRTFMIPAIFAVLVAVFPLAAQPPDLPDDPGKWADRAKKFLNSMKDDRFVPYHDQLTEGNLVILGRLKAVSVSRKKRADSSEVIVPGLNGELGRSIVSGLARAVKSNFYHADGKSILTVDKVLYGTPSSDRVRLRYRVQIEKTANGKSRYVMLGENPARIAKSLFGVWILKPEKKPRGVFKILRLVRYPEKSVDSRKSLQTFMKKQEDYFEVNSSIRLFKDVLEAAQGYHETNRYAEAVILLEEALKDRLKIRHLDFEDEANSLVKPYRTRVEKLLKKFKEKLVAKKKSGEQ